MELCASVPWKYRDRWNNGCRITKGPRQSCVSLKETWQGVLRGKNWLPVKNGTARLGIVEQPTKTDHCDNEEKLVAEYLVSDLECARIYANTPCNQASWCFAQVRKMKAWKREPYTRDRGRDLTERIQIQSWATTSMTRRSHRRHDRRSSPCLLWNCGRCCLLDVSTSVCGSERPRTGLLSLVSPNQKTGSTPYADWSTTATVNTVIGQSVRVTHGYRLPQQYLRSISPPWLPCRARYLLSLTLTATASPTPCPFHAHTPRLAPITSGQNSRGQPLLLLLHYHPRETSNSQLSRPPANRALFRHFCQWNIQFWTVSEVYRAIWNDVTQSLRENLVHATFWINRNKSLTVSEKSHSLWRKITMDTKCKDTKFTAWSLTMDGG